MNKKIIAVSVAVTVLFAGVIIYYNHAVSFRDSEIANLHQIMDGLYASEADLSQQVNDLNNDVANLKSEIGYYKNQISPHLVTALGCTDVLGNAAFNHLWITGTITNEGLVDAYNVCLNVVAYQSDGTLIVNSTTPIGTLAPLQVHAYDWYNGLSIPHEGTATTWSMTASYDNG